LDDQKHSVFQEFVKLAVLIWSAAMLTSSYMGFFQKMDPTFIASLLSGTLASYGISRSQNGNSDNKPKEKKE